MPDGTNFGPGQEFTKVWRMRSSGCAAWSKHSRFVFVGGDQMGAPESVPVPETDVGNTADIGVDMVAPGKSGTYRSHWQMRSPDGAFVGAEVYVEVTVSLVALTFSYGHTADLRLWGPANYEFRFEGGTH